MGASKQHLDITRVASQGYLSHVGLSWTTSEFLKSYGPTHIPVFQLLAHFRYKWCIHGKTNLEEGLTLKKQFLQFKKHNRWLVGSSE